MKKKVLFINGHLNVGGVEKSLLDILCNIDLEKYDVELLLLEELGDYYGEIPTEIKVKLFDLHNTYGSMKDCILRCVKKKDWKSLFVRFVFLLGKIFGRKIISLLRPLICGNKIYDYAVGFRPGICTDLVVYTIKSKRKFAWWHHGEYNLTDRQSKEYVKVCNKLDCLITVSQGCRRLLQEKMTGYKGNIAVIPNMLDINQIKSKSDEYVPFLKDGVNISFVTIGRLSKEKHIENTVLASKKMVQRGIRQFKWYIVGEGDERGYLVDLINQYGMQEHVILVGKKSNPYPFMKYADILVHTSYVESQCLVALEAMALGRPCVLTDAIGPSEFAVHKENCILVQQNVENLVQGIMQMIDWLKVENNLKEKSIQTAEKYSNKSVMKQINELLK